MNAGLQTAPGAAPVDRQHNLVDRHVGMRLQLRRTMMGVSRAQLARVLGVTQQQVHKYETGVNRLSAGVLHVIAVTLDVPVGFFFDDLMAEKDPADTRHATLASHAADDPEANALIAAFGRIPSVKLRRKLLMAVQAIAEEQASLRPATPP